MSTTKEDACIYFLVLLSVGLEFELDDDLVMLVVVAYKSESPASVLGNQSVRSD